MKVIAYKNGNVPKEVFEEVSKVLHDAFEERLSQGIYFKCGSFSAKDVENEIANGGWLLVVKDGSDIVGTLSLILRKKGHDCYASHDNLAIASSQKGKGLAVLLFKEALKIAKENNLDFINSFTATKAESSVRYHLKVGFLIYGKSYGKSRNSYSFIFPLRKYTFLRNKLICKIFYFANTAKNWLKNKI